MTPGAEARLIATLRSLPEAPVRLVAPDLAQAPITTTNARHDQRRVDGSSPLFVGRLPARPDDVFDALTTRLADGDGRVGRTADVEAILLSLGFRRTKNGRLEKGDTVAKLRPSDVGGLRAVHVEISGKTRRGQITAKGVALGGAMFAPDQYAALEEKYVETIDAFTAAIMERSVETLPTDLDGVKALVRRGESPERRIRRAEKDAELATLKAHLTETIRRRQANGDAPRGVVLYLAGPDAVGKTSTGKLVQEAFVDAGYSPRHVHFRAPKESERAAPLERFRAGFPEDGEIVFWDRGPAGDAVYGPFEPAVVGAKVTEIERELADRGVLMIPVELFADPGKQARTMGKRLARNVIADRIAEQLARHDRLTPERIEQLDAIRENLDVGDFLACARYEQVQQRFLDVVAATPGAPWIVLDATKRHAARRALAEQVDRRVERAAVRSRASA